MTREMHLDLCNIPENLQACDWRAQIARVAPELSASLASFTAYVMTGSGIISVIGPGGSGKTITEVGIIRQAIEWRYLQPPDLLLFRYQSAPMAFATERKFDDEHKHILEFVALLALDDVDQIKSDAELQSFSNIVCARSDSGRVTVLSATESRSLTLSARLRRRIDSGNVIAL